MLPIVFRLTERRPVQISTVNAGHSEALRRKIKFDDGSTAFLKAATEALSAEWLAIEIKTYETLDFDALPKMIASSDEGFGAILLEDLSNARWLPPWHNSDLAAVLGTLNTLRDIRVSGFADLDESSGFLKSWQRFLFQPKLLDDIDKLMGPQCSEWIATNLDELITIDEGTSLGGSDIVHRDLRSDNICVSSRGPLIIDWGGTSLGNSFFDVASILISCAADGNDVNRYMSNEIAPFVCMQTGFLASRVTLPDPFPGSAVRSMQQTQLVGAIELANNSLTAPSVAWKSHGTTLS